MTTVLAWPRSSALIVVLVAGVAAASMPVSTGLQTYENAGLGFRIEVPAGWRVDEAPGLARALVKGTVSTSDTGAGRVTVMSFPDVASVAFYGDDGSVVIVHTYLEDAPTGTTSDLIETAIAELRSELGAFQVVATGAWTVGGRPGAFVSFSGVDPYDPTEVLGTTFVVIAERHLHSLTVEWPYVRPSDTWLVLQAVLGSFAFLDDAVDPWVGVFADDRLTAVVERSADGYVGELELDGLRYPWSAVGRGDALEGTFSDGSHDFAFTAVLDGAELHLTTGAVRYTLRRRSP